MLSGREVVKDELVAAVRHQKTMELIRAMVAPIIPPWQEEVLYQTTLTRVRGESVAQEVLYAHRLVQAG